MISPSVRAYWKQYGGWSALLRSRYFQLAILLALVTDYFSNSKTAEAVATAAVGIVGGMLAFTLSAFAVFLAMPFSGKMREDVLEVGSENSFYMAIVSSIFHFIFIQVMTLIISIFSLVSSSRGVDVIVVFGVYYSVLCGLACAVILLGFARLRNAAKV